MLLHTLYSCAKLRFIGRYTVFYQFCFAVYFGCARLVDVCAALQNNVVQFSLLLISRFVHICDDFYFYCSVFLSDTCRIKMVIGLWIDKYSSSLPVNNSVSRLRTGKLVGMFQALFRRSASFTPRIKYLGAIQGGPKMAQFLYALTLPNINRLLKLFHCQNQKENTDHMLMTSVMTSLGTYRKISK